MNTSRYQLFIANFIRKYPKTQVFLPANNKYPRIPTIHCEFYPRIPMDACIFAIPTWIHSFKLYMYTFVK